MKNGSHTISAANKARYKRMLVNHLHGFSYAQLGFLYGVSKQRAHQIVVREKTRK
jgi:hypothetical protein